MSEYYRDGAAKYGVSCGFVCCYYGVLVFSLSVIDPPSHLWIRRSVAHTRIDPLGTALQRIETATHVWTKTEASDTLTRLRHRFPALSDLGGMLLDHIGVFPSHGVDCSWLAANAAVKLQPGVHLRC